MPMRVKTVLVAASLAMLTITSASSKDKSLLASDLKETINQKMDDFHDAADKGDKTRYLNHFAEDGVFMGTDDWERWSYKEFSKYVNTHFKDGKGWSYSPVKRFINSNKQKSVTWVDEIVESEKWGRFRGTAVLEKSEQGWKLKHYSLTKLVPNESWEVISEITEKAFSQRAVDAGVEPILGE